MLQIVYSFVNLKACYVADLFNIQNILSWMHGCGHSLKYKDGYDVT